MQPEIIFVDNCMQDCHLINKGTLQEKAKAALQRAQTYVDGIEDGGTGKLIDKTEAIFIKFFKFKNRLFIDQIQEQVHVQL